VSCFLFGSIRLSDTALALSDMFALKLASAGADFRLGRCWYPSIGEPAAPA